jgi:anaphase-promoting complex subunit 10
MYFDYLLDESYTPSRIAISAGTGLYDLTEVKVVDLHQPRGWQTVHVGDYGREYSPEQPHFCLCPDRRLGSGIINAFLVQIVVLANHQNGKDTHLRGVKIFAPGTERSRNASGGLEGPWLDDEQERIFSIR